VLGAGDSFMSGFLRGWLKGEDHATSEPGRMPAAPSPYRGCCASPEIPTWEELQFSLRLAANTRRCGAMRRSTMSLGNDPPPAIAESSGTRDRPQETARRVADQLAVPRQRIADFKALAVKATANVARGKPGYGMLLDVPMAAKPCSMRETQFWIARPLEEPGSRPLRFDSPRMSDRVSFRTGRSAIDQMASLSTIPTTTRRLRTSRR